MHSYRKYGLTKLCQPGDSEVTIESSSHCHSFELGQHIWAQLYL